MDHGGDCILCGGALIASNSPEGYAWDGREFAFQKCRDCGSRIVHPLPSENDLAEMYRQDRYHATHYADAWADAPLSAWRRIVHMLGDRRRLLDFGCGNGSFLKAAMKSGFEVIGVETDPTTRATAARNSGRPVWSLAQVIESGQRFDVIHLGDVLEHLPAPAETLRRLEPLLSEDGLFFIEGPLENNASLVRVCNRIFTQVKRAAGKSLLAPSPPFHLSQTSATGQRRFLEQTMGYELRLFEMAENGWPYLVPNARSGGIKAGARRMIGRAAVLVAGLAKPLKLQIGNRFAAVAVPKQCV